MHEKAFKSLPSREIPKVLCPPGAKGRDPSRPDGGGEATAKQLEEDATPPVFAEPRPPSASTTVVGAAAA